jgi:hypothetical protein
MKKNRLKIILGAAAIILIIPLIVMQFTNEVNWNLTDFIVAGLLLFVTGLLVEFALRKAKNPKFKTLAIIAIVILSLLIWAELAIGLLGTPFAGS